MLGFLSTYDEFSFLLGNISASDTASMVKSFLKSVWLLGFASTLASSQSSSTKASTPSATSASPLTLYTLTANDITAVFLPYGARLTSLLVPDRNGKVQDVVVGYDTGEAYVRNDEANHTYFGPIVGRYANRIKNSTFTLPDGDTYHVSANENGGLDTLHGGKLGYDQRNWTVLSHTESTIAFSLLDTAFEGFPGTVMTTATFSLGSGPTGPDGQARPRLTSSMVSVALDEETPIMLANHIYWNLNAFEAATILNDTTLWMPYSDRYIDIDNIEIPTGGISSAVSQPSLDFLSPKAIGPAILNATGLCGFNCTGIDNAFILDRPADAGSDASDFPVLSVWSNTTGIRMDISTNQQGLQIYTCNGQNGTIPVKQSQQNRNKGIHEAAKFINKYGCFVIETQAWIDGINHPEWGVQKYEIFSPTTGPAINYATYDFSTF